MPNSFQKKVYSYNVNTCTWQYVGNGNAGWMPSMDNARIRIDFFECLSFYVLIVLRRILMIYHLGWPLRMQ